jgi:pimeloyl-ACP methyl ester carboxylesterase
VRSYGIDGIAGVNFVAAVSRSGGEFLGPDLAHVRGMTSDDLAENSAATRAFVRALFAMPPEPDEIETVLAYTMLVPARVRAAVLNRSRNPGDMLPRLALPVLVTQGALDRMILPEFGRFTAEAVPGARLSLYEGAGHSPFREDAPRFNRELAELVRATTA